MTIDLKDIFSISSPPTYSNNMYITYITDIQLKQLVVVVRSDIFQRYPSKLVVINKKEEALKDLKKMKDLGMSQFEKVEFEKIIKMILDKNQSAINI